MHALGLAVSRTGMTRNPVNKDQVYFLYSQSINPVGV